MSPSPILRRRFPLQFCSRNSVPPVAQNRSLSPLWLPAIIHCSFCPTGSSGHPATFWKYNFFHHMTMQIPLSQYSAAHKHPIIHLGCCGNDPIPLSHCFNLYSPPCICHFIQDTHKISTVLHSQLHLLFPPRCPLELCTEAPIDSSSSHLMSVLLSVAHLTGGNP